MAPRAPRPSLVLAVVCAAVFAVNVDVTIVNVALPSLATDLGASTRGLQWIVDAYTLTFAALVLAGGSLADRFGRREVLLVGLVVYGVGNLLAASVDTTASLTAARAVMGVGAAMIFPTTLAIITNVFVDRPARARALGIWGATTGLAVAVGPVVGGALLESFWWGSTFLVKVPLAVVVIVLTTAFVPTSRDHAASRLDLLGLVLSSSALAVVVATVIEAPERGWASAETLAWAVAGAGLLVAFVAWELRTSRPMLDLRVFRDRRFSMGSVAVTLAFFALAGFIFLITQYFQFLRAYGPLETGVRILPVAGAIAVTSVAGTTLAVRIGTKAVVGTGLALLAVAYAWVSTASVSTGYGEIAAQMVLLGSGMGLTSAPATEAIMGAVPEAKAGIGSAVNDATRELGATLGVAVIGSVFAWLYAQRVVESAAPAEASDGLSSALVAARELAGAGDPALAAATLDAASAGFFDGLAAGCLVAGAVAALGSVLVWWLLPGRAAASTGWRPGRLEPVAATST